MERIHVVGAAGAGASAATLLARLAGGAPDGCDPGGPSPYTPALEEAGIRLAWRHDPEHVTRRPPPDRLAVTKALTAIAPDHPELVAAREAGIPVEPWQQVVADAAVGRRLVGVAGTHGKSTTSGWLVHVLVSAGADPSASVGALLPPGITGGREATARWGGGATFVIEADEYAGNFDPYRPDVAVVTNAEWDHPDVFADLEAVLAAFTRWLLAAGEGAAVAPTIVANTGDAGVLRIVERVVAAGWSGRLVAVSMAEDAVDAAEAVRDRLALVRTAPVVLHGRIVEEAPAGTVLGIEGLDPSVDALTVRLPTAGRHNAANALLVAGAASVLGLSAPSILAGLASFEGIGRRLERKGEEAGVAVYDDYAHHPTAIRETLLAVRQREPGRRVWAVYEPLTYHRTAALLDAFAAVLADADGVAIADIWAGRDPDTSVTSAADLAAAVSALGPGLVVSAPGSVEATASWLAREVRRGDVVLVMGGGRSYRIGELLLDELRRRA